MPVIDGDDQDFRSVLATSDRRGRRRWLHVHLTGGVWRRRRAILSTALIGFLLWAPFWTMNGHPFARIDIPGKTVWAAGTPFHAQDLPYLLPLALILIIGTALMVALVGRFFCGWLCPHSVFLEQVFRPLERLIQGSSSRRKAEEAKPTSAGRARVAVTWVAYGIAAGAIANALTALFIGTHAFVAGLVVDPVNHPTAAVFWLVSWVVMLFNFAWFREQTCTIVCPYGRLQTVMLDPHALVVGYDPRRGEPRGKGADRTGKGDCVDCRLCVDVCPTGIDIRNGNQLECIHCTACIDACDGVMAKVKKPAGLIAFTSEVALGGGQRRTLRPRTILYGTVMVALTAIFVVFLTRRPDLHLGVERNPVTPTAIDQDGTALVRQALTVAMTSGSGQDLAVTLSLPDLPDARLITQTTTQPVAAGARSVVTVLVDAPRAAVGSHLRTRLVASWAGGSREAPVILRGP